MEKQFKKLTGMIPFFDFREQKRFTGSFTGKYKEFTVRGVLQKKPVFVNEDGEEFILPNSSMIMEICETLPVGTTVEIIFRGVIKLKNGNTLNNYQISYLDSEEIETPIVETETKTVASGKKEKK